MGKLRERLSFANVVSDSPVSGRKLGGRSGIFLFIAQRSGGLIEFART